jgi:NhaP-type Na+/H+ or K+/H+ antiporter
MHWGLATVALALLGFAVISGRIAGTPITAAMIFTGVGLLVGSDALGLVEPAPAGETVKLLAEATLALVLFADASRIDVGALRGELSVPLRLLGIGLPLTLVAGFLVALVVLPELLWAEALLLAVILAPTDAALGQAVVTLTRLPSRVRQGLNVESGLNDGICVPLFWIVLAIAQAESGAIGEGAALQLVLEQIGYGLLAGVGAGAQAAPGVMVAGRPGHVEG